MYKLMCFVLELIIISFLALSFLNFLSPLVYISHCIKSESLSALPPYLKKIIFIIYYNMMKDNRIQK